MTKVSGVANLIYLFKYGIGGVYKWEIKVPRKRKKRRRKLKRKLLFQHLRLRQQTSLNNYVVEQTSICHLHLFLDFRSTDHQIFGIGTGIAASN